MLQRDSVQSNAERRARYAFSFAERSMATLHPKRFPRKEFVVCRRHVTIMGRVAHGLPDSADVTSRTRLDAPPPRPRRACLG